MTFLRHTSFADTDITDGLDTPRRTRRATDPRRTTMRDRLQPALLDRLVDDHPAQRTEAADAAMMSRDQLRAAVLRDLRWLLNTVNLSCTHPIEHLSQVQASTVNFGVRALAGQRMSDIDWADVEESIRQAIVRFEPRILPTSVEVACIAQADVLAHYNILSLEIRGMLWCVPFSQAFLFRTDIDLESGHMDLRDVDPAQTTARRALAGSRAEAISQEGV